MAGASYGTRSDGDHGREAAQRAVKVAEQDAVQQFIDRRGLANLLGEVLLALLARENGVRVSTEVQDGKPDQRSAWNVALCG